MYQQYKDYRKRLAGKQYEAYIAQKLRQEGWQVYESGLSGVNDHGIDLIASKDGIKRYVQCKGYKKTKFVYEDVVSQLYGSVAAAEGPENLNGVELYIYSPAQLNDYAAKEAEKLNIRFERVDFPPLHKRHSHGWYRRKHRLYDSASMR